MPLSSYSALRALRRKKKQIDVGVDGVTAGVKPASTERRENCALSLPSALRLQGRCDGHAGLFGDPGEAPAVV